MRSSMQLDGRDAVPKFYLIPHFLRALLLLTVTGQVSPEADYESMFSTGCLLNSVLI
jgi:hypothetical protein